ncbi:hypothetical protein GUI04_14535, partial [Xanthomonas citri pv. citri]|nr:hypothetical protein [Xanthomonas citri pv. citri]
MDLSDLHHLFQMFDHNGDGKISIQELSKSLESLGIDIPDADLAHMIDHVDTDGDGMVNMDEFTGLYKMILMEEERDEEEDLREAFNVFDKNGDGFISVEELQSVMMSLGLRQGRTIEDCQLMVNKVDVDG